MTAIAVSQIVSVRPLVRRLISRYWLSAHVLCLPPVATLYVLTVGPGTFGYVLLLHVLLLAVGLFLTRCLVRAKIDLGPDGFTETDLFTRPAFTPRGEMSSILILSVTDGNSVAANDHLFLIDVQDRTRLRMRGQFWGDDALGSILTAYDLPVVRVDGVKTMADLRSDYGRYIYWRERHPYLLAAGVAAAIAVLIGPILWMIENLL